MKIGLVGHSGFVGSNLKEQCAFGALYNSKNIREIEGEAFDLIVCAAAPATMWLANKEPDADRANIDLLFSSLAKANAQAIVLISTIAVYADAAKPVDEAAQDYEQETPYGRHRRLLEERVSDAFETSLVMRLPALWGNHLKKNFIFDIINPTPSFVKPELYDDIFSGLGADEKNLFTKAFATDPATGMRKFDRGQFGAGETGAVIENAFRNFGFTAMQFTNPESCFQFYDLRRLWRDIETAIGAKISDLNMAAEPLKAGEIYETVFDAPMPENKAPVILQDMRSRHGAHFGADGGYLFDRQNTLKAIAAFISEKRAALS